MRSSTLHPQRRPIRSGQRKGGAWLRPALQQTLPSAELRGGGEGGWSPAQAPPTSPLTLCGREAERRRRGWLVSHRRRCFPYVSLWPRDRERRERAGEKGGVCVCVCVGAASVPRASSPRARAPPARGPPRGGEDDRRGGGGGRALSGTCRSPRYGAARALAPCLSTIKVAAGVRLAGPSRRCRAARWVLEGGRAVGVPGGAGSEADPGLRRRCHR